MLSKGYQNGDVVKHLYDAGRRNTSIDAKNLNQQIISQYAYGYNKVNLKNYEQRLHDGNKGDAYAYDALNRIKNVKFDAPDPTDPQTAQFAKAKTYNLDKVDNILKIVENKNNVDTEILTEMTASNAKLNQYSKFDQWTMAYDQNGNATQKGSQQFSYNFRNQLVRAIEGSKSTTFGYDAFGRRFFKEHFNGSTSQRFNYFYAGNQVIEERNGSDVTKQYVYGNGIDELLRLDVYSGSTSTPYYVHTNDIGSTTAITDSTGELVERVSYDTFGLPSFTNASGQPMASSSIGNATLFQGREFDSELNLYNYRARYYDPIIGRFLQTDTVGYKDSMNLYQGFENNPMNFIDPMGEDVEIMVGRPYRKQSGEWSKYGHVAIRVVDEDGNEYDQSYDFGRYGKTRGIGNSMGEGILNVASGHDYLIRESRERDTIVYRIRTDKTTDNKIINYYDTQISEGRPRQDLQKNLGYPNSKSYQLKKDYDAAVITGWGRNTCVTKTIEGCEASKYDPLEDTIADALDELYPENVEKNLEDVFAEDDSPIVERRIYRKGKTSSPERISHSEFIKKKKVIIEIEKKSRKKAWKEPK